MVSGSGENCSFWTPGLQNLNPLDLCVPSCAEDLDALRVKQAQRMDDGSFVQDSPGVSCVLACLFVCLFVCVCVCCLRVCLFVRSLGIRNDFLEFPIHHKRVCD